MNNLLARRSRRLVSLGTVLAVAAGITVPLLMSGGAQAASISVKLTDPVSVASVTQGATFASGTATLTLPAGAVVNNALLASSPDGLQNAMVDDGETLVVNGGAPQRYDFTNATCNAQTPARPPVTGLQGGSNTINWSLHDTCGGASWSTALYVVVSYTVRAPSKLTAYAELADVAQPPAGAPINVANLAGVHLFNLYARLTTVPAGSDGPPPPPNPLAGRTIAFHAGSTFVCSAVTDSTGLAHCGGPLRVLSEIPSFRADFAGDASYLPSTASAGLVAIGGSTVL